MGEWLTTKPPWKGCAVVKPGDVAVGASVRPNGHSAQLICITTPYPLRVKAPVRFPGTTAFGVVAHLPPIPGVTPRTA